MLGLYWVCEWPQRKNHAIVFFRKCGLQLLRLVFYYCALCIIVSMWISKMRMEGQ